jgi:hypothetical protein
MLFVSDAAPWRKKDPEVVSSDESPDDPGNQKDEQEKIALVGVDERLTGRPTGLFREFLDHRFVNAGPGGGSAGRARRPGEEKSRERQDQ